ncbi:MAG: translation initiation factor IF-2 [Thermodesulfobacteriota bacterium]
MAKTRIYELARALNLENKALLSRLAEMGIEGKSHTSTLEDDVVERVKQSLFAGSTGKPASMEQKRVGSNVIRKRKQKTVAQPEPESEEIEQVTPEEAASAEEAVPEAPVDGEEAAVAEEKPEQAVAADAAEPAEAVSIEAVEPLPEQAASEQAAAVAPEDEEKAAAGLKKKAKVKKSQAAKIIKFLDAPLKTAARDKATTTPARDARPDVPAGGGVPVDIPVLPEDGAEADRRTSKKARKKQKRSETEETDDALVLKKVASKRKEIVEGADLYDIKPRGRLRKKGKGKVRPAGSGKTMITTPKAIKRRLKMDESITVSDLAKRMGVKAGEVISVLMRMGVMATVNQNVDFDTAVLVAAEFEYEVEKASMWEEDILLQGNTADEPQNMVHRAPVVTIMGHVDHGKTSLLDVIRKSRITETEAGGITQHIGAYKVNTDRGDIVFLDTPGHEAFTAMRSRGAQATDIVVLVVAADDGVMPQTIEAINHSRAANVPIVVAINKIDKEHADTDRVKRELADQGLLSEDWGGDTIFVNVSAKQKIGIDSLLDMILLQSEMLELKANPNRHARGIVLESEMDPGQGPLATVLVREGTLSVGQTIVCGVQYGKIRAMVDDAGRRIDSAGPSTPVEVFGLNGVADAGDEFIVLEDEKNAKLVSETRMQKQRAKDLTRNNRVSLENFFEQMKAGDISHLNLIIKADVNGSCEAIEDALMKIRADEVQINVIHSGAGAIIESDVLLASASNAIILGFNVRPSGKVKSAAAEENVDIRYYNIIYDLIGDIKEAVTGLMSSTYQEHTLGRAEVREVFVIPKKGSIAGSFVLDGKIERGRQARLVRDGVVIYDGIVGSLRHYKDDVKEVKSGSECGIGIEQFNDIKVNDVIECYYQEEIKPVID